jgi:hypothetical protein
VTLDDLRVKAQAALQALEDVIPPHLRSSRHGQNFMGARYDTIREALDAAIRSAALRNNVQGDERGD